MSGKARVQLSDPEGEFLSDVPVHLFLLAFQAVRRNDTQNERLLKPLGVTLVSWRALLIIDRLQPCTMNELARVSTVERTTLTRTIDQLVADGLATRTTPPEDRRKVLIALTPAGVEALDAGKLLIYAGQKTAVEAIDPERLREAARVLTEVVENLLEDAGAIGAAIGLNGPDAGRPGGDASIA